jgi:hypothetical protein
MIELAPPPSLAAKMEQVTDAAKRYTIRTAMNIDTNLYFHLALYSVVSKVLLKLRGKSHAFGLFPIEKRKHAAIEEANRY